MKSFTKATVVFLRKEETLCLARKKKAIHHTEGEISYSLLSWNGYGGKQEEGDKTIEDTALRELQQESGVDAKKEDLQCCGHVFFFWPGNESDTADMEVFFYTLDIWSGEPQETNEMGQPQFFKQDELPFEEMMAGDVVLIPRMLAEKSLTCAVYFSKENKMAPPTIVPLQKSA